MKRFIFTTSLILIFSSITSIAQIGAGFSSHGFALRSDPDQRNGVIARSGFGFSFSDYYTTVSPEVAFIRRHHFSDRAVLYGGIGVKSRLEIDYNRVDIHSGLFIPVGLEMFPIRGRGNFSISLETGVRSNSYAPERIADHGHWDRYSMIELTFYLSGHGRGRDRDYDYDY